MGFGEWSVYGLGKARQGSLVVRTKYVNVPEKASNIYLCVCETGFQSVSYSVPVMQNARSEVSWARERERQVMRGKRRALCRLLCCPPDKLMTKAVHKNVGRNHAAFSRTAQTSLPRLTAAAHALVPLTTSKMLSRGPRAATGRRLCRAAAYRAAGEREGRERDCDVGEDRTVTYPCAKDARSNDRKNPVK